MNDDNKEKFQNFLEEFCRSHHGELTEDDRMPMRFFSNYLTVQEVEAECIDWVLQYLTSKCPYLLAVRLARTIADYVLELDLSTFLADDEDEPGLEAGEAKADEEKAADMDRKPLEPDTVLLVSALAPVVFTKVHTMCHAWSQSLPDNALTSNAKSPVFQQVVTHATKNGRRKMEDRHVVLPYLGELYRLKSRSDQSYIAVFDGHGGLYASIYASAHFHDNLIKHPDFDDNPANAIKASFRQTDEEFCNKAMRESLGSGTTGVCALLQGTMLHVGWLGDSEALLVKDGQPVTLVTPHKPERKDEQERIEALGGFVEYTDVYRVNGFISVARAIGDRNLKPYLCSDADITSIQLDGTEDYIVLACDGLWDVVTHEEIVTHVYHHVAEHDGDKSGVAQMLIRLAQDFDSEDNITVVVVFFKDELSKPQVSSNKQDTAVDVPNDVNSGKLEGADRASGNSHSEAGSQEVASADSKSSDESGARVKHVQSSNSDEQKVDSKTESHQENSTEHNKSLNIDAVINNMTSVSKGTSTSSEKVINGVVSQTSKEPLDAKEPTIHEKSNSQEISGSKETSGDKEMLGSKECTGSKEVLLSWTKGSSGVTSYSSPHPNRERLLMSLQHLSRQDSKDSSEAAKEGLDKSSSKSSKMRSVHIETLSGGSGGSDLVLMSQTATKCVGYRRGRRGRNGRRRNNHRDNRRASKESQNSGIALRTNGMSSRVRSSSESKVSAYVRPQREPYSSNGKDGVFRMLMGYNPYVGYRPKSHNRWTVAVAMETDSAAAMFDDVAPKIESATLPRRQRKK